MPRGIYERTEAMKIALRRSNFPDEVYNPPKGWTSQAAFDLWYNYRLVPSQYEKLLIKQNNHCKWLGCFRTTADKTGRRLHVDHDHETGLIRGLLCTYHNRITLDQREEFNSYLSEPQFNPDQLEFNYN